MKYYFKGYAAKEMVTSPGFKLESLKYPGRRVGLRRRGELLALALLSLVLCTSTGTSTCSTTPVVMLDRRSVRVTMGSSEGRPLVEIRGLLCFLYLSFSKW
jgi:hypothetical protein